jgi:hypothetical protein
MPFTIRPLTRPALAGIAIAAMISLTACSAPQLDANLTAASTYASPSSAAQFSEGEVNIQMTIQNNTTSPLTLSWSGLSGDGAHWDSRPQATLGAGASEVLTGYTHFHLTDLAMQVNYETASGDLAQFHVTANGNQNVNSTTGTGVTLDNGGTATDLTIDATVNQPTGFYDYAVASMVLQPVS